MERGAIILAHLMCTLGRKKSSARSARAKHSFIPQSNQLNEVSVYACKCGNFVLGMPASDEVPAVALGTSRAL